MLVRLLRGRSTPAMRAIELLESLTLTLLVLGDYANHPHHTLAVDDLALITNLLYRCSYFHKISLQLSAFSPQQKPGREGTAIIYTDKRCDHGSDRRAKARRPLCRRAVCG